MNEYKIIILRERPELAPIAAEWFHCKWGVPTEAYLECMEAYLSGKTENGWWLCLYGENIVAGLLSFILTKGYRHIIQQNNSSHQQGFP